MIVPYKRQYRNKVILKQIEQDTVEEDAVMPCPVCDGDGMVELRPGSNSFCECPTCRGYGMVKIQSLNKIPDYE